MDMPPCRYRVEERGRRLIVVDRRSGEAVSPATPPLPETRAGIERPARRRLRPAPRPSALPGSLTTRSWYDAKAPRTLRFAAIGRARLDRIRYAVALAVAMLIGFSVLFWPFFPLLLVAAFAATRSRRQMRIAATRAIDWLIAAD